jgi:hypothetical protein
MNLTGSIRIMAFSREMRRRSAQSARPHQGGPGGPNRPRGGGGCCIFVILLIVGLVVYAYLDAYVLHPRTQKPEKKSLTKPAIVASAPDRVTDLLW